MTHGVSVTHSGIAVFGDGSHRLARGDGRVAMTKSSGRRITSRHSDPEYNEGEESHRYGDYKINTRKNFYDIKKMATYLRQPIA